MQIWPSEPDDKLSELQTLSRPIKLNEFMDSANQAEWTELSDICAINTYTPGQPNRANLLNPTQSIKPSKSMHSAIQVMSKLYEQILTQRI